MKKNIKVSDRTSRNYKKEKPAIKKSGKQSRKSGKGTSLMHAAAKRQSVSEAAESNQSPAYETPGKPAVNRADAELARLQKGNA